MVRRQLPVWVELVSKRKSWYLTHHFNHLKTWDAATSVVAGSHSVNGLDTNSAQVSLIAGVGEVVIVEDLLTPNATFSVVESISTHGQRVANRRTDRVGLYEYGAGCEAVVGLLGTCGEVSGEVNPSEVLDLVHRAREVSFVVAVQTESPCWVDSEDVERSGLGNCVFSSSSGNPDGGTNEVSHVITVVDVTTDSRSGVSDVCEVGECRQQRRTLASTSGVENDVVVSDDVVVPLGVTAGVELVAVGANVGLRDGLEVVGVRAQGTQASVRSKEEITRNFLIDVSTSVHWLTSDGDKSLLGFLDDVRGQTFGVFDRTAGTCTVVGDQVGSVSRIQAGLTKNELEVILLGSCHPLGHDLSGELIDGLAGETHELENLRPGDSVTDEIDLNSEGVEVEIVGGVLENFFTTYALSTDRSNSCEHNTIGATCGEVALFGYGLVTSFASDELCEYVFFPGVSGYEFGPDF